MKTKTINKVINKKFDDFCLSIKDKHVRKLVQDNSIITGGCIASMLMKEPVNDFDVYFTNKQTVLAVADYYVKEWNAAHGDNGYVLDGVTIEEDGDEYAPGVTRNMTPDRVKIVFKSKGVVKERGAVDEEGMRDETEEVKEDTGTPFRPIFISCNAITLSSKIQIIIRFYGSPEHIHLHYDYVHCTNYWLSKSDKEGKQLFLNQPALEAILSRELIYIGSLYPIASMIRTRKFIKRNFTCNAGQYLKMAYQISKLNLDDINALEDQLVGVDVAYFQSLINALAAHKEKNPEFIMEYSYLATIIDKIF